MKKISTIACAALAGTLGFSSAAFARDGGDHDRGDRANRFEQRQERREAREQRWDERRDERRADRRDDRGWRQGPQAGAYQPRYEAPHPRYVAPGPRYAPQPSYGYRYDQPSYRSHAPRFSRGGYLPHEYRQRAYYVNDWHSHGGLYAPPYGHQWVNVDGDFLLVALATGIIANLLVN
jgi:Ni/Co efflux regulator RcnB